MIFAGLTDFQTAIGIMIAIVIAIGGLVVVLTCVGSNKKPAYKQGAELPDGATTPSGERGDDSAEAHRRRLKSMAGQKPPGTK